LAGRRGRKDFAMARRDRQATLGIETQR